MSCSFLTGQTAEKKNVAAEIYKSRAGNVRLVSFMVDTIPEYVFYYRDIRRSKRMDIDFIRLPEVSLVQAFMRSVISVIENGQDQEFVADDQVVLISNAGNDDALIWTWKGCCYFSKNEASDILMIFEKQIP